MMTSRVVSAYALAAGLALLLTLGLTFSARGREAESADQALLPGEGVIDLSRSGGFAAGPGHTSQLTFTPVATLHLPVAFDNWNPCGVSPTLIAPFSSLYTIAPLFRWDGGDNPYATQLRLRISEDPEFDDWVRGLIDPSPQGEHSFRFHDNLKPDTVYYWRAWLVCGELGGPYSEVLSFRTGAEGILPLTPTLTTPDDGTTTSSPSVTLAWEPVTGTREYLVRYREPDATPYAWEWTTATEITVDLSGGITYEWWVAARNDYGIGPDSEIWRFTTPAAASVAAQGAERRFRGEDGEGIVIETP
jgi:hypothetical protein